MADVLKFDDLPGEVHEHAAVRFDDLPGDASTGEGPGAGATAGLNLGNALSLVGLPNVLAAQDAARHSEAANSLPAELLRASPLGALVPEARPPTGSGLAADFRKARAIYRQKQAAMNEEHPKAALAGNLGTLLVGGNPSGVGQLALTAGAQGGLQSDELAAGDIPGAIKQAALSGGVAGAGGLALEGLGAGVGRFARTNALAKGLETKIAAVRPSQLEAIEKAAAGDLRSGVSALGGESSAALKTLDRLEQMVASPRATPAQKEAARALLASPTGEKLYEIAFSNALERAPQQAGRVETARAALDPLRAALDPAALETATDEAMQSPVTKHILPGVARYAQRAIPAVVASKLGGGAAGAAAGGVVGAAIGHPGTWLKNLISRPSVQAAGLNAAQSVARDLPAWAAERAVPAVGEAYLRSAAAGIGDDLWGDAMDDYETSAQKERVRRAAALAAELSRPRPKKGK